MTGFDDFDTEVQSANNAHRRRGCGVNAMLAGLDEEDAQKVIAVLADPKLSTTAIYDALRKRVEDVPSSFTFNRHRRGHCGCNHGVETK